MKVALTGGSGVVGTALARLLIGAGHEVVAIARDPQSEERLRSLGARTVPGDVLDPRSLPPLVNGADWVFNVAGVNELCSPDVGHMWDVNVEGTRNVLDACLEAGVARVIHTSSASTIGHAAGELGSERTKHRGWFLSEYERSKHAAETLVLDAAGVDVVVVNPSSVQGPGRSTGTGRILLTAVRGRLPLAVETTISLVDIDDCARGHLLAAETGRPGERYLLSGASLTTSEAVRLLSEVVGIEIRTRYVSPRLLAPVAGAVSRLSRLMGRRAPLCREMVAVLEHGHSYDGSKATRELGLRYTPLGETLERTVSWFRQEGLAPTRQ